MPCAKLLMKTRINGTWRRASAAIPATNGVISASTASAPSTPAPNVVETRSVSHSPTAALRGCIHQVLQIQQMLGLEGPVYTALSRRRIRRRVIARFRGRYNNAPDPKTPSSVNAMYKHAQRRRALYLKAGA